MQRILFKQTGRKHEHKFRHRYVSSLVPYLMYTIDNDHQHDMHQFNSVNSVYNKRMS